MSLLGGVVACAVAQLAAGQPCPTPAPASVITAAGATGIGDTVGLSGGLLGMSGSGQGFVPDARIMRRQGAVWVTEASFPSSARVVLAGDVAAVESWDVCGGNPCAGSLDVDVYRRRVMAGGQVSWASIGGTTQAGGGPWQYEAAVLTPTELVTVRINAVGRGWAVAPFALPPATGTGLSALPVTPGPADTSPRGAVLAGDDLFVPVTLAGTGAPPRYAVLVYTRAGGAWALSQTLPPPLAGSELHSFAQGLAAHGDTMVVTLNDGPSGLAPARVLAYRRTPGSGWAFDGTVLSTPDPAPQSDRFGRGLALDGARLVVGANESDRFGANAGIAYLYDRVGGGFTLRARLGLNGAPGSYVGFDVAVEGDLIALAAPGYMSQQGAGVVFDRCSLPGAGDEPRCEPGLVGLFAFLRAWFAGEAFADYNRVGGVELLDIFAYLTAWFSGCP